MKKKALAIVLALCMVLSMLPATVFAAHDGEVLTRKMIPSTVGELEPATIEPNAKSYKVSLSGEGNGEVELLVDSPAEAGSEVYFVANPDDGYLAEIYYEGLDEDALVYVGADVIGFIMPANKVTLNVKFVAAEGESHSVKVYESGSGQYALSRESAKQYESILLGVLPDDNADFDPMNYVWCDGGVLFYLFEEEGIHYYEIIMGEENVTLFVTYEKTGPFRVSAFRTSGEQSCTVTIEPEKAYFLDTVTVTIVPSPGYELTRVKAVSYAGDLVSDLTPIGNNQYTFTMHPADVDLYIDTETNSYPLTVKHTSGGTAAASRDMAAYGELVSVSCTPDEGYKVKSITAMEDGWWHYYVNGQSYMFTMPDHAVEIFVTFGKIYNPVTVTVDTGLGGTACADLTEARAGDIVTVTCTPEEGYRVALVTGVDGITDNGDNTYTFTMPDDPADIHVLFLRHENPFVDVNETHFFYDPVLWAVGEGITNGIDDTHFGPFQSSNRAAVVTMLWRWAGSPKPTTTENPFTDVPDNVFYSESVLWAVENGITKGITPTEFGPGDTCNRAQVVTFLYRYLKASVSEGVTNPFEDVPAGSWYEDSVLWALQSGVTTGADTTHFDPTGQCLRAQFVTFLYRTSLIPPAEYALSWTADPAEGGTVALSHETAAAGETITVTVTPAEGWVIRSVKCESGAEVFQVGDGLFTFIMPIGAETVHVSFMEAPDPEPTDPEEPDPTDPEEPTEPGVTYNFILKDNGYGKVAYKDGVTSAAPGESIFFYAVPNEGFYLDHVGVFNPDGTIDVSTIRIAEHGDDLYELIMIPHDLILTCYFYPAA